MRIGDTVQFDSGNLWTIALFAKVPDGVEGMEAGDYAFLVRTISENGQELSIYTMLPAATCALHWVGTRVLEPLDDFDSERGPALVAADGAFVVKAITQKGEPFDAVRWRVTEAMATGRHLSFDAARRPALEHEL